MSATQERRGSTGRHERRRFEWTIDGAAFRGHGDGASDHTRIPLAQGRFNHLGFSNRSARLHPIHLHGMFFRVLARNGGAVEHADAGMMTMLEVGKVAGAKHESISH